MKRAESEHRKREAELLSQLKATKQQLRVTESRREADGSRIHDLKLLCRELSMKVKAADNRIRVAEEERQTDKESQRQFKEDFSIKLAVAEQALAEMERSREREADLSTLSGQLQTALDQALGVAEAASRNNIDYVSKLHAALEASQLAETENQKALHEAQEKETSSRRKTETMLAEIQRLDELVASTQRAFESERQQRVHFEGAFKLELEKRIRLEQEAASQELLKKAELDRKREKKRQETQQTVGCPVAIRQVGFFGGMIDDDLNKGTPAILRQMKIIKESFSETFPVTKVEYIMNDRLYKRYDETRATLRQKRRNANEVLLFHGTKENYINSYVLKHASLIFRILTEGFQIGGVNGFPVANGSLQVLPGSLNLTKGSRNLLYNRFKVGPGSSKNYCYGRSTSNDRTTCTSRKY